MVAATEYDKLIVIVDEEEIREKLYSIGYSISGGGSSAKLHRGSHAFTLASSSIVLPIILRSLVTKLQECIGNPRLTLFLIHLHRMQ